MSSRTQKILTNAKVSLLFFMLTLGLGFISRGVFIQNLGSEVLGVNTLVTNLIGFLNLAEMGIVSAIASSLYKPLAEKNYKVVEEIVTVQGWLYRKIAYIIMFLSCILMLFFPLIFNKVEGVSLIYIYSVFIVFLFSSLLTYFFTYIQVVIVADMQEYRVTYIVKGIQIVKIMLQILFVSYSDYPLMYWLVLEFLSAIISSAILYRMVKKYYPWLLVNLSLGKELSQKHSEIITHTKQLFFHKFSTFVLYQTTPIIIYLYLTVHMVTIYGNYMLIITGLTTLFTSLFSSIQAGVGNLVATSTKEQVLSFFYEYFVLRFWLALVVCLILYFQSKEFIILWLGNDFVLNNVELFWLIVYTFLILARSMEVFIVSYKLFSDIYAPIAESVLNLSLSLILGYFFGLSGILIGIIISLLVIVYGWKAVFLYRSGFNTSIVGYFESLIRYFLSSIVSIFLLCLILPYVKFCNITNIWYWIIESMVISSIIFVVSLSVFMCFISDFRRVLWRVKKLMFNRLKS